MYQSTHKSMHFKWKTELYADLRWKYDTFIPCVCVVTGGERSGGVVTLPGGEMGDIPCGVML